MKLSWLLAILLFFASMARAGEAILEFRLVAEHPGPPAQAYVQINPDGGDPTTIYLEPEVLLDSTVIRAARANVEQAGWVVTVQFTRDGSERFGAATAKNVDRQLAIIVGGKVISAPVIRCAIAGGSCEISGNFTEEGAKKLADDLDAAAATPAASPTPGNP